VGDGARLAIATRVELGPTSSRAIGEGRPRDKGARKSGGPDISEGRPQASTPSIVRLERASSITARVPVTEGYDGAACGRRTGSLLLTSRNRRRKVYAVLVSFRAASSRPARDA